MSVAICPEELDDLGGGLWLGRVSSWVGASDAADWLAGLSGPVGRLVRASEIGMAFPPSSPVGASDEADEEGADCGLALSAGTTVGLSEAAVF